MDEDVKQTKNSNGSIVYLVGVDHINPRSAEVVRHVIERSKPDTVFLELSVERRGILKPGPFFPMFSMRNLPSLVQSISSYTMYFGGISNSTRPGDEMRVAAESARKVGAGVVFGDRNGDITYKRMVNNLTFVDYWNLFKACYTSPLFNVARNHRTMDTTEIKREILRGIEEINRMPTPFRKALVEEKNQYLASGLRESKGKVIVAVIGKGHVQGVLELLNQPLPSAHSSEHDLRTSLSSVPESTLSSRFGLPLAVSIAASGMTLVNATILYPLFRLARIRRSQGGIPRPLFGLTLVGCLGIEVIYGAQKLATTVSSVHTKLTSGFDT